MHGNAIRWNLLVPYNRRMSVLEPWQLLVLAVSGWINRYQQDVIAYIQEENRILKRKLKGKRIRFTDNERRRLAVKGFVSTAGGPVGDWINDAQPEGRGPVD